MKNFLQHLDENSQWFTDSHTPLLIEGAFAKFKVGEEPKFGNKFKQEIADRLADYVKMNPSDIGDIHYSATGSMAATFKDSKQTEIKITDKKTLARITKYMSIFDVKVNGDNTTVTNNKVKVLFKFSSGRGFFFQSESSQKTPSTDQQEMGTIKILEYFQLNGKLPTMNELNDMVGFVFDEQWHKSFVNHAKAITSAIKLKKTYKIELDSDSSSIGQTIFSMLKTNHKFKEKNDNWNPADIWIYDSSKKSDMLTKLDAAQTVSEFNLIIKELFVKGSLYGVSLKKAVKPTKAKIIDTADNKPFDLAFAKTVYDVNNTYYDIKTSGYPKDFMIRARAKASAITKSSDIKIYFEGKIDKSTEFLGAIAATLVKTPGSDTVSFEVTTDHVESMAKKVSAAGPMTFKNLDSIKDMDEMKLTYIYVMLRYALNIYTAGNDNLKKLAMAGYKLNDYSSIHYKVGG